MNAPVVNAKTNKPSASPNSRQGWRCRELLDFMSKAFRVTETTPSGAPSKRCTSAYCPATADKPSACSAGKSPFSQTALRTPKLSEADKP